MKTKAYIFIVLASVLWGTSGLFVAYIAPYGINALQMTAARGLVSALVMGIYILIKDRKLFALTPSQLVLYFLGGVAMFVTQSCYYSSMQATSVSTAVVLMYTAPIFVMIYSVAFLGEKLTPAKSASVVTMIIGCVLVSGVIGSFQANTFGILLGLMSGISYSAYNIITKIQMRKILNPYTATFYCFSSTAVLALCFSKPMSVIEVIKTSPEPLLLLVGMGFFTCFLPYIIYTIALKTVPAGTATTLGILEPMAATVFSVLLLGERLSLTSLVGIILILFAVFLLSKSKEE